eukprot:CAMPEP_0181097932 /NCGR_PEP_ID=MMETSP1071-20121207/11839_1 /TAXON_ID=35127 /ORGANISM="Thalassiosira sp., Strain NH16" /LENGTH=777 /DNA_ID=CAMNT_0023180459 /DNA_START=18 /DNA_END=2354 /DNA_ORIENTATION=-
MTESNTTDPTTASPVAAAAESPPVVADNDVIVGIDLGALSTKVTLGPRHDHELVRNAHGGHATPTAITFPGKNRARLIGENAAEVGRADGNTVGMLDRLLPGSLGHRSEGVAEEDALTAFRRFQMISNGQNEATASVPNAEEEYSATALMAMFLGSVRRNAIATVDRLDGGGDTSGNNDGDGGEKSVRNLHFVFAVPPSYPASARDALMDAAYASSANGSSVVDSTECTAAVYERKFGDVEVEKEKIVLVVEMGHARSCVSILKKVPTTPTTTGEEEGTDGTIEGGTAEEVQVLSAISSPTLGAGLVDVALYRHFLASHPSLSHHSPETFGTSSRPGQRLLEGCRKLKHLLSMLPENTVTVENIGKNDSDVSLSCTRELMKELCRESVIDRLNGMIESAIEKAGGGGEAPLGEIDAVEITGGGSRIPMVQEAIRTAIGRGDDFVFARSLDDTSLAFGASLIGNVASTVSGDEDAEMMDAAREARRSELLKAETAMSLQDVQLLRKDEIRNQIEAHILELRSARHSKHGSLLPSSDEFTSFLDTTDDWLFTEECDDATVERMEEKWNAVQTKTNELCEEYLSAKRSEAEEKDREMEREAKLAAVQREMEGDGDEEEDHDTRRLPTKRRMEIVMKNKNEANELFSDGNYRHAAARYAKALTHCSKFFDLKPEDETEVRAVKMSLNLNMALAYIKLEKLDNALRCCNDVLGLDGKNVKALYRRATVLYQKRKFDDAMKDLKEAEGLSPEDKAVKKLTRLVDQQMVKQKKKEKAMAKKMFG